MSSVKTIKISLRLTPDLAARLDNLSATYNKRGRLHVVEEILEQCVEIYELSEKAKYKVLRSFIAQYSSDTDGEQ